MDDSKLRGKNINNRLEEVSVILCFMLTAFIKCDFSHEVVYNEEWSEYCVVLVTYFPKSIFKTALDMKYTVRSHL